MILFYCFYFFHSVDGTCSDCETDDIWIVKTGIAAAVSVTVIVIVIMIMIMIVTDCCIYKRWSNGKL